MSRELDELAEVLRWYADLGVRELFVPEPVELPMEPTRPRAAPSGVREIGSSPAATPSLRKAPSTPPPSAPKPAAAPIRPLRRSELLGGDPLAKSAPPAPPAAAPVDFADLPSMATFLHDCTRCKLSGGRTQVVFGVGNPNARIMFVGEGPGEEEDRRGEPFVGAAGQLLTDVITKGMGIRREDVYIANVVKCRPPGNRDPEPDEVAACSPFLRAQIGLVKPEVIVTLGKFASHSILGVNTPITRLRGNWGAFAGIPVMPTLHPAYVLRQLSTKKDLWSDIKQVMERLGMEIPAK